MLTRPRPQPTPSPWRRLVALASSRLALVFVAAFVTVAVGLGVYATWLWRGTVSATCVAVPRVDLEMAEVIDIRRRLDRYQSDPSPDAEIGFTGREISFLLRDALPFELWVDFVGDRAEIQLAVPRDDGTCLNVRYSGSVEVTDGVAVIRPASLVVGEVDWTGWVGSRRFVVSPERIGPGRAAELLANTAGLQVDDGQSAVRLVDRWEVW